MEIEMSNAAKFLTRKQISKLLKAHGGWWDECGRDVARFPSPHAKEQFERAFAAQPAA